MRTFVLGTAVAACALVLAAVATAGAPTHVSRTRSAVLVYPAGTACDFTYSQTYSIVVDLTFFTDGTVHIHLDSTLAHTNTDTRYTLTEEDHYNVTFSADGGEKDVGLLWHLRDASGKLVVVHAGQIRLDSQGNLVEFTPNSGPDFAAVICPALGGNPA